MAVMAVAGFVFLEMDVLIQKVMKSDLFGGIK